MKRILLFILICCHLLPATAQKNAPKWMDKSKKAVVLITTYGKDGAKLTSGTGIFVSETGDVLSAYELFKGAEKATVTDTDGKTYPVTRVIGADELYDVIKVKAETPKKVQFLPVAADPLAVGTVAYLLPYSTEKKADFEQGTITEVSKLKDPYSYYKLSVPLEDGRVNSPILNAEGEVFGLAQADASGKKDVSYAVSASYVNNLAVSSTDFLNSVYNNIGIKKAWPADVEQAQVALFLKGSTQDAKQDAHQMVKGLLNTVNRRLSHDDAGKLLLRLAVGGLMLFHGIHKLIDGVDGISGMLAAQGLPGFIAYGVLVGEVVAPCLLILGVLTRPAALVLAFTMVVAWLMVGLDKTLALDAVGAWAIENLVYFFVGALAIALLGAGRYSLAGQSAWR